MGDRTLYLIRHGQYTNDPQRLTDLGRAQSEVLASRLRTVAFDAIHSSSAPRAIETASPLRRDHPDTPGRTAHGLCECIPFVPRRKPEIASDAEALARSAERLQAALKRFCRPTRGPAHTDALVFHGNFIRALTCVLMGFDPSAWIDMQIHHCSITVVRVGKEGNRLVCYNDTGHLPPAMVTDS